MGSINEHLLGLGQNARNLLQIKKEKGKNAAEKWAKEMNKQFTRDLKG